MLTHSICFCTNSFFQVRQATQPNFSSDPWPRGSLILSWPQIQDQNYTLALKVIYISKFVILLCRGGLTLSPLAHLVQIGYNQLVVLFKLFQGHYKAQTGAIECYVIIL